jgi:BirA family biotin operon repressor/biotin-[acetyl-CoA-carboxylase] ligase
MLGYRILSYGKVSSTNDVAKEIAGKSSEGKLAISAEMQTRGKGRAGRSWFSPKGGLWLSIVLRPAIGPKEALRFTFVASLAVAKTIRAMFGLEAGVKWPNDVLVNGRKICGILTETKTRNYKVDFVVVGIGINANIELQSFPQDIRESATSLLHELGFKTKLERLTENLLRNFEYYYMNVQSGKWSGLLQEWKSTAPFLGKKVHISSSKGVLVGKAQDVDDDGALVIALDDGTTKRIVFGDIRLKEL